MSEARNRPGNEAMESRALAGIAGSIVLQMSATPVARGVRGWAVPAKMENVQTGTPAVTSPVSDLDRRDIEASLRGDENAYARLIERYQATIIAQMWRFSRDRLVVEELVQEVFVENGALRLTVSRLHETVPSLMTLLREHAVELGELATHHATLEDVFLSLTGRHLRDD